ncbi:hypothetical protein [Pseudoxanthomonas sp. PXM04]|uniref:hypothetical protein n=1 Tax=Pseudoxanthomonas sp. PXM04 TaxID=2769297 RepID=UPI001786BE9E|nr:hypothetical protein [Pseudoxanthomonas sp. PXM04]MBD9376164.1 hypothetical protein [Pseudoxanthomonas sp. PXM04]
MARGDVTITIPCAHQGEMKNIQVRGQRLGAFVVFHQCQIEVALGGRVYPGWSVTHAQTGLAAIPDVNTQRAALNAAKELQGLAVDWDFSDPLTVKRWPRDVLAKIQRIREIALGFR